MSETSDLLLPYCSESFVRPGSAGGRPNLLSPLLGNLYNGFNGGYFWNRALLVRPIAGPDEFVLTVASWNEPSLWRHLYGTTCDNVVFFAEDAFGLQFGILSDSVVQFDPETATITHCASTLNEWVSLVIGDPAYFTGAPVLAAWESKHSKIRPGYRLLPKQLFILGGEFHSANMVSKSDVQGMRIRAQFWELTRDLPDGQKVVFRVEE